MAYVAEGVLIKIQETVIRIDHKCWKPSDKLGLSFSRISFCLIMIGFRPQVT